MRAYTTNVLPTDAAYYTLANATMASNQLHILAGGSATIELTAAQLSSLTEYFRVTATMTPSSNAYSGGTYVIVKIISSSGEYISHFCNVVTDDSGIFSTEIEAIAEDYTTLQIIIRSATECTFTAWGLEPETSDGDVQVEIDGVKQSLPKLLYDYNTTRITVGQTEHLVGMISCYLTANTDLQGHFLMNVNAAERCIVYLRFYDNDMEELFSPLLYTIDAGLTTITVPHAYLSKLVGIHNFTATAQVTNGSLTIPVRSMLYTIDGGYLAERLLNPGIDTQDIAVQQLSTEDTPSSIYAIGIDNDIITVKKHAYAPENANEAWEAVYTLGEGIAAALEFNGTWVRRTGDQFYTLECEDTPWAFWIDSNNTLYGQRGAVETTKITLATDVSYVCAVRGYKSALYPTQDQGIIVTYLKSGIAYYRNYCMQSSGNTLWEEERELTQLGTNLTSVHVHRLNDYRVGFVGSSASGNVWIITERTYVAAAFPPETFNYDLVGFAGMAIVPVADLEYDVPAITAEVADNWLDLYVNCQYSLLIRNTFEEAFTISSNNGAVIASMELEGTRLHIVLSSVPASGTLTMIPRPGNVVAYLDNCGYIAVTESWVFLFSLFGYGNETFDYTLAVTNAEILLKPLGYFTHSQDENFDYTIVNSASTMAQKALIYSEHTQDETFEYTLGVTAFTLTESFIGVEPI